MYYLYDAHAFTYDYIFGFASAGVLSMYMHQAYAFLRCITCRCVWATLTYFSNNSKQYVLAGRRGTMVLSEAELFNIQTVVVDETIPKECM